VSSHTKLFKMPLEEDLFAKKKPAQVGVKSEEARLMSIAWLKATDNGVVGVDQKGASFYQDYDAALKAVAPPKRPDGTYDNREASYIYLRDTIFPDIQKFNTSLRMVFGSEPTGCSQHEKINMAVAVHMKQAKKMDYMFKYFDTKKWRFYEAWVVLKASPKFALSRYVPSTSTDGDGEVGVPPPSETTAVTNGSISRHASRGGPGRGKSKAALYHESMEKKRSGAIAGITDKLDKLAEVGECRLQEQKKARKLMATQCALGYYKTVDAEKAKALAEKLIDLSNDDDDDDAHPKTTPFRNSTSTLTSTSTSSDTSNTTTDVNTTPFSPLANITNT
jgi:hypothetical protein